MPDRTTSNNLPVTQANDRPITTILEELTTDELSRLAVDVIVENRRLVSHAQSLFEQLEHAMQTASHDEDQTELRHAYRLALVEMKAHHELVRIVVDKLGHVPDMPPARELH